MKIGELEIPDSTFDLKFIGVFRTIRDASKCPDCKEDGATVLTPRYFYVRVGKTWEKICKTSELLAPPTPKIKLSN